MQKIIPIYIMHSGEINGLVGINANRIHEDIGVQKIGDSVYTKIKYKLDSDGDPVMTLYSPEDASMIYRQLTGSTTSDPVALTLVGGGTLSVAVPDVIFCYSDKNTFQRSTVDIFESGRRKAYRLDMSFFELIVNLNSA